jgi:hypothetical protein
MVRTADAMEATLSKSERETLKAVYRLTVPRDGSPQAASARGRSPPP